MRRAYNVGLEGTSVACGEASSTTASTSTSGTSTTSTGSGGRCRCCRHRRRRYCSSSSGNLAAPVVAAAVAPVVGGFSPLVIEYGKPGLQLSQQLYVLSLLAVHATAPACAGFN